MKLTQKQLAQEATVKALLVRRKAGYTFWDPICAYDLADCLGIEVRFFDIPSMEGVYCASGNPTIIVSSLRPPGRQAFTCAHELGHHVLGHGDQYDELVEQRTEFRRTDPNEFQADCFAGALLMPKVAVSRGFSLRGWDPATCPPELFYIVATWLGVGYITLIHHTHRALKMLSLSRADALLRHGPLALRSTLLGRKCREQLIVADRHWYGRAIDVQVGDLIQLPPCVRVEGQCSEVIEQEDTRTLASAAQPGIGRAVAQNEDWSAYIRVSRKNYIGRGKYRFEEEADDAE